MRHGGSLLDEVPLLDEGSLHSVNVRGGGAPEARVGAPPTHPLTRGEGGAQTLASRMN